MLNTPVKLTKRQLDVLILISKEYTTKEICEELSISKGAVQIYKKALFEKLEVTSSIGLVIESFRRGWFIISPLSGELEVVLESIYISNIDNV